MGDKTFLINLDFSHLLKEVSGVSEKKTKAGTQINNLSEKKGGGRILDPAVNFLCGLKKQQKKLY